MLDLKEYRIDPVRGFLPAEDPLTMLPPAFAPWEEACAGLTGYLMSGKTRKILDELPEIDPAPLQGLPERWRAYLLLSTLANAYIMGERRQAEILPRQLAAPLAGVSRELGLPPVFTYSSMILHNWRRVDPSAPVGLDNITLLVSYYGGMDEHWFLSTMTAIEAAGGCVPAALVAIRKAIPGGDDAAIAAALGTLRAGLAGMLAILERLPEKCDPYVFYHRVRPILDAWREPGVIYQGVSEQPQMWIAASAAQSSLVQAIDRLLDIGHGGYGAEFLGRMLRYMPAGHRRFLQNLQAESSFPAYLRWRRNRDLIELYNENILLLGQFRKLHLEITARYLVQPAKQSGKAIEYGTSGTHFSHFLGQIRKETSAMLIST